MSALVRSREKRFCGAVHGTALSQTRPQIAWLLVDGVGRYSCTQGFIIFFLCVIRETTPPLARYCNSRQPAAC